MLDDAKPAVIAANIFGRTMLAFPAFLLIAWMAAGQEEGESWAGGDGYGAMIFSLAVAATGLTAMLLAPLNRFRRARPAVVLGWSAGALITLAVIGTLTYTAIPSA